MLPERAGKWRGGVSRPGSLQDGIKQREGWHFASFTSLVLSCLVRVVLLEWDMEVWKGRWI